MAEKEVKIYTTPTCPWCRKVKEYLDSKNVKYTDYNVGADREKLTEMINISGQRGVPVIVIGDETIVGFNQTKIDEALAVPAG